MIEMQEYEAPRTLSELQNEGEQTALADLAMRKGGSWREVLKHLWWTGSDERAGQYSGYLRAIRNSLGPLWINNLPHTETMRVYELKNSDSQQVRLVFNGYFTLENGFDDLSRRLIAAMPKDPMASSVIAISNRVWQITRVA